MPCFILPRLLQRCAAVFVLLLLAIAPVRAQTDASAPVSTPGDQLVAEVVRSLTARDSIAAKLEQGANLMGVRVLGRGHYLQQGRGSKQTTRLELQMQSHSHSNSLLEIKDNVGDYLWRERRTPSKHEVSKVNLRRLRRAWQLAEREAGRLPSFDSSLSTITIAGLPRLVSELAKNFQFGVVREDEIATHSGSVAVFEVVGHWRTNRLAAMLPDESKAILAGHAADLTKLPEHIPHEVMLLIDRETRFPHVFEYRRYLPGGQTTADRSVAFERIAWMQLFDVELDRPIDPRQFLFKPGPDTDVRDVTEQYLPRNDTAKRDSASRK